MSANPKWKLANKEQISNRNKMVVESLENGETKSSLARRFDMSVTGISRIYEMHNREQKRLNSNYFIDTFKCVRTRNCLKNVGVCTFGDLITYATVGGVWDKDKFLGKGGGWNNRAIIPNFGKTSYVKMLQSLDEKCTPDQKKKLQTIGFYENAPLPNTEMKERALYERLKKKYG